MPFSPKDAERHIKGLSPHQETVWARVANSVLSECGDGAECEGKAIRQANAVAKRAPKTAKESQVVPLAAVFDFLAPLSEAELSFDQQRNAVSQALRADLMAPVGTSCWVRDLYPDTVVYELEGPDGCQVYRRSYTLAGDGSVTFGDPEQVRQVTTYEPVSEALAESDTPEDPDALEESEFEGDLIPLLERALGKDGTMPLKVIAAGWGSSGHYPADVLKRDGPTAFPAGTQMHIDHPSLSEARERPERSLQTLAAVTVTPAEWQEDGPAGPGLYAQAKPFANYAPLLEELSPHIGVSIRASGFAKTGEAEGRKGPIIERLAQGHSIDFVTKAGAGGKVLQLMESAGRRPITEEDSMTEAEAKALQESLTRLEEQNRQQAQALERLQEAAILREAQDIAAAEVRRSTLPDLTQARVIREAVARVPVTEGVIDREAFATQLTEAIRQAAAEVNQALGSGAVRGLGSTVITESDVSAEEAEKQLVGALGAFGLRSSAARIAVGGR
jgi:hypothetical protein